jgi:hypothetical protein
MDDIKSTSLLFHTFSNKNDLTKTTEKIYPTTGEDEFIVYSSSLDVPLSNSAIPDFKNRTLEEWKLY